MTITATISLSTSDLRRFADPALRPTPATAPAASVPAPKQSSCDDTDNDAPRRSPVYRALIDALGALVAGASTPSAPTPASTPTPAAAPAAKPEASATAVAATDAAASSTAAAAPAPELADALQNFAHALMQALRGGDGEHRGHHRGWGHHHDNGRRAWGDPAQRVGQLGAQLSAGASSTSAAAAPGTPAATASNTADTGASAATPAATPAPAADAVAPPPASGTVINLTININAPASTRHHATDDLLEAFGTLQKALGKSAPSGISLQSQLASFLQALADQLKPGSVQSTDIATQPGALLNVAA